MVLHDETEQAQFLNCLEVPLLHAPQVHLLEHFAVFQPLLFHKKLCVEPAIFDCIIDKIHKNVTFHSGSNNLQLPISIQLAIFLNHAGHYGNVISPEDVAQWAGVSVGSVVNCTPCNDCTPQLPQWIHCGTTSWLRGCRTVPYIHRGTDLPWLAEWHLCCQWLHHSTIPEAGLLWRDILW